jgi:putative two-component system response regulator
MYNPTYSTAASRPTILVVDDAPENLEVLHHILNDSYRSIMASSGARGLELAQRSPAPDLVLLDISMPEMDGYEVCRALKADERTCDVPVIFVTANAGDNNEHIGLSCGAVDYITKPVNPALLRARIRNHLVLKQAADRLRRHGERLEQEVAHRTRELSLARDAAIHAMASLAEARDNETGHHIRRTQNYVRILAEELAKLPKYREVLTPAYIDMLYRSAPLHDIGKVGVPDSILRKPGRLTPEEFEIMKGHAEIGRASIERAELEVGSSIDFLGVAKEIAHSHHESWDGSGYPLGLKGEEIPLSARLMALADVYDALISHRVYKPAMPHAEAVAIIRAGSGTRFDPAVILAFERNIDRFLEIGQRYADPVPLAPAEQLP